MQLLKVYFQVQLICHSAHQSQTLLDAVGIVFLDRQPSFLSANRGVCRETANTLQQVSVSFFSHFICFQIISCVAANRKSYNQHTGQTFGNFLPTCFFFIKSLATQMFGCVTQATRN